MKNEIAIKAEKMESQLNQHKEETDQLMMKMLKQMKDQQSTRPFPEIRPTDIKQDTIVSILVRIEVIELELEKMRKKSQERDNMSRGGRRSDLKEFDENRVQISELKDLYTQTNMMMEKLILRIAD